MPSSNKGVLCCHTNIVRCSLNGVFIVLYPSDILRNFIGVHGEKNCLYYLMGFCRCTEQKICLYNTDILLDFVGHRGEKLLISYGTLLVRRGENLVILVLEMLQHINS